MHTRAAQPGSAQAAPLEVRGALREGIARLRDANVPSHTLAAELLLIHALGRDRTWIYSHPETFLEPSQTDAYFALLARRAAGEPTQYLTGKQEFWGLDFEVNRDVLIPRPETEHVVEVALERIARRTHGFGVRSNVSKGRLRISDVGTGSGCIAVALARELPHSEIVATDISSAALEVARRNAAWHGVADRVHFVRCDLLEAFAPTGRARSTSKIARESTGVEAADSRFDVIVSNPPYVARDEAEALPHEVREHEPDAALFGGAAGTEIYEPLIEQAARVLGPGGILVLELGYNSAPHVEPLVSGGSAWTSVEITNDLAGIPRVIAAERA